ncbi:unnamed protein product [Withania somnifera]
MYLSWFGLAKWILVAPKVTKAELKSIAFPHPDIGSVLEVLDEMKTSFKDLQPIYLPFLQNIPLEIGMSWEPTWKSTPLLDNFVRSFDNKVDDTVDKHELAAFIWNIKKIHSIPDGFFSPGILWREWIFYPFDRNNTRFAMENLDFFEKSVGPYFASLLGAYKGVPLATGRLAQVIEGGVNSSLGLNTFLTVPPMVLKVREIAFLTGQPLGYYGSWSLFALSHHYIVWLAAKRAYPTCNTPFVDYALLGDDILITDVEVAQQYRILLDKLGVTISVAKSIISENGTIEFAKRYWTKDMQVDLSPISLRALTSCRTTVGLCQLATKYAISQSILQRLGGAGFRVRSRLFSTQSKRWERLKAAASKPHRSHLLPLEFWIGRGKPLNPYLKGKIIDYLRKELKPKEIGLFPEELVFDGEREILERTLLLRWVKEWLK